jgi:hypothetical protein
LILQFSALPVAFRWRPLLRTEAIGICDVPKVDLTIGFPIARRDRRVDLWLRRVADHDSAGGTGQRSVLGLARSIGSNSPRAPRPHQLLTGVFKLLHMMMKHDEGIMQTVEFYNE